jgi:hypothetical protein
MANWEQAAELQKRLPHTYLAMERLIMAMADAHNSEGKTGLFGRDRGLASYKKFEAVLKDTLLALTLDGVVRRDEPAASYRAMIVSLVAVWMTIFPGWPDAEEYTLRHFVIKASEADAQIKHLIGTPS